MSTRNLPMCHGRYSTVNTCALWNELTKYYEDQLAHEEREKEQARQLAAAAQAAVTTTHPKNKTATALNLKVNIPPTPATSPTPRFVSYLPIIVEETDDQVMLDEQVHMYTTHNYSYLTTSEESESDQDEEATFTPVHVELEVDLELEQQDPFVPAASIFHQSIQCIEPKYTQVSTMNRYQSPSPFSLDEHPASPVDQKQVFEQQLQQQQQLYESMTRSNTRTSDSYNLQSIWHALSHIIFFLHLLHPNEPVFEADSPTQHQSQEQQSQISHITSEILAQQQQHLSQNTKQNRLVNQVIHTVHSLEQSPNEVSPSTFMNVLQQVFTLLQVDLQQATNSQSNQTTQMEIATNPVDNTTNGPQNKESHDEEPDNAVSNNKETSSLLFTLPSV